MKRKLSLVFIILCLVISCQKYDDTQIKKDISDLQEQVASLKAWCESSQSAINAVETLKKAVDNFNGISYVDYFTGDNGSGYNIGLDNGEEITIYNVKQKGSDAYLGNISINLSSVVFTLSDGTSFSLPRKDGQIHFASYDAVTVNLLDTVEVLLPEGFKKSDFAAFTAKVESGEGVATKAGYSGNWGAAAIAPEFDEQGVLVSNPAVVFYEIPFEKISAVLTVSVIDNNGSKTSTSRVINSGNEDKLDVLRKEWDEVFKSDTKEWDMSQYLEYLTWYMLSLVEEQPEEGYSDFLNKFVANHRNLLEAYLLLDRNDDATENIKKLWEEVKNEPKELEEDDIEGDENSPTLGSGQLHTITNFYDWMGKGASGWGLKGGLPDSRKVCHVTLPAAYQALSKEPILPKNITGIANMFLSRLLRFQHKTMDHLFYRGVRVFDFQVGMYEGALHGYSDCAPVPVSVPCQAKVVDELNVLANYLKKYPQEFAILVVREAVEADLAAIHRVFHQYSEDHNNLFVPFRKDLTVKEARGHIILLWTNEEWPDESLPRFGAVMDEINGCIKVWDNGSNVWKAEAPLWTQNIDMGKVANNDEAIKNARTHTNQMMGYIADFTAQARKEGDCTWSINYYDKSMWWPLPENVKQQINKIIKEKCKEWFGLEQPPFEITHYPDASWSAKYLHNNLLDDFDAQFYKGRQNATGGIIYMNYAAVRDAYGPFRVMVPLPVYGRTAVAYTLGVNGPCTIN